MYDFRFEPFFSLSMLLILVRFINVNKLGAVVALLIINCLKTIIELNEILNVVFFLFSRKCSKILPILV